MRPLCVIAGDNVSIEGDVVFIKGSSHGFTHVFSCPMNRNVTILALIICYKIPRIKNFWLWILWVWHMVILQKEVVYLVGVLRK